MTNAIIVQHCRRSSVMPRFSEHDISRKRSKVVFVVFLTCRSMRCLILANIVALERLGYNKSIAVCHAVESTAGMTWAVRCSRLVSVIRRTVAAASNARVILCRPRDVSANMSIIVQSCNRKETWVLLLCWNHSGKRTRDDTTNYRYTAVFRTQI